MAVQVYWYAKRLEEMTRAEWESLCDGCGKCCLHKLQEEDTEDVYYTKIACRYLDHDTCRCQDYERRQQLVPGCVSLTPENLAENWWLPDTCAYRLLAQGFPLFDWHPLISGDPESVHKAGMSVRGKVLAEGSVPEEDYEEHIIRWL
jgi:uncharacterized cysteine cluster protein YcgN (CxxCxxCC family)